MATSNAFQQAGGDIFGKIFGNILYFGIALVAIGIIVGVLFYFIYYKKKFDIIIKIMSERSGDPSIYFDKGAILYDRTNKINYLRIRDTKYDLPNPPFNIIQKTNWGDFIELYRRSQKEFIYLEPGTIDKLIMKRMDGTSYPIAKSQYKQLEGDVEFWNVKSKGRMKKLFGPESMLMKLLPYIPLFLGGIFMIFILYILMDNLPNILSQLADLVSQMKSLKGATVTTG